MGNILRRMNQPMSSMMITKGTPNIIQSPKVTFQPFSCMNFRAMALGGVPMGVPIPPTLAPIGMHRAKAARPRSSGLKRASTGVSRASIMAAVAVLLMNMENRAVTLMRPSSTYFGFVPKGLSSTRARLMSRRNLVAASARKKPPRNRMMMGSAKVAKMLFCWVRFTRSSLSMLWLTSPSYRRPAASLSAVALAASAWPLTTGWRMTLLMVLRTAVGVMSVTLARSVTTASCAAFTTAASAPGP